MSEDFPFLNDATEYAAWRADKLRDQGTVLTPVTIANPLQLTRPERAALLDQVGKRNYALYEFDGAPADGNVLEALCRQFGLAAPVGNPAADAFGLSRIEQVEVGGKSAGPGNRARYIPYTNRPLNWHTDGYYNDESRKVRSFVLHCVRDAEQGGGNIFLDPEILYIQLRDEHPDLLRALCRRDAFTIPADRGDNGSGRGAFTGAVFSQDRDTGKLYTRYTQRRHHIHWRQDPDTSNAVSRINEMLEGLNPALLRLTLKPGQGILCNNVLHCRAAFDNGNNGDRGRLLYRLRFNQRIGETQGGRNELS